MAPPDYYTDPYADPYYTGYSGADPAGAYYTPPQKSPYADALQNVISGYEAYQTAAPLFSGGGAGAAGAAGQAGAVGSATGVPAAPVISQVSTVPASSTGATVAQYAWPVLAAYGVYDAYNKTKAAKKKAEGGALTSEEAYKATHPTFAPEWLQKLDQKYNPISWAVDSFLGSSKDDEQLYRDRTRTRLKKGGLIDENYNLSTSGGGLFDIGTEDPLGDGRHRYDVNFNDPNAASNVGFVNPLAAIVGGNPGKDPKKTRSDFAGYFTNAISQGGDARQNARELYQKAGLDYTSAMAAIEQLDIPEEEKRAYQNGLNDLYNQDAYAKGRPALPPPGSDRGGAASGFIPVGKNPASQQPIPPGTIPSSIPLLSKKIGKTVDRNGDTPRYGKLPGGGQPVTRDQANADLKNPVASIPRKGPSVNDRPRSPLRYNEEQTFQHVGNRLFQNRNTLTDRLNRIPRKR